MTNHCCVNDGNDKSLLCECWQWQIIVVWMLANDKSLLCEWWQWQITVVWIMANDKSLLCEWRQWQTTVVWMLANDTIIQSQGPVLQITLIVIFPPSPITLGSFLPFYVVVVIVCYQPEVEVECDVEECQGEKAEPENISLQKRNCFHITMLFSYPAGILSILNI